MGSEDVCIVVAERCSAKLSARAFADFTRGILKD
jgi:hypothetical protein